ncbi:MAG: RpiB/LacA/LacB family sugar-phosphate isomerase [Chloroflexota bacterium]
MKLVVGCDDAGDVLLDAIRAELSTVDGVEVVDMSAPVGDAVEYYPDVAERVANTVAKGDAERGILICGTGLGMAMTACKVPGIRAATCHDVYSAERAIKSNNAQILAMGARVIGVESAKTIVQAWLNSEYVEGTRSEPKVKRMIEIEQKYM